ncbi:MAG: DUF1501 domain-containing protein, partial [Verrucomicrobiota bacterium]
MIKRRDLIRSAGFVALAPTTGMFAQESGKRAPHFAGKAKRVIFLLMPGGPSHVDTFQYKPEITKHAQKWVNLKDTSEVSEQELKGTKQIVGSPFEFKPRGESGLMISNLLPHLSEHADDVCLLNGMPFFSGESVCSSTPHMADKTGLNAFERNRRFGRTLSADGPLTTQNAFRGSTKGAHAGPYLSQFMLIGATSLACGADGQSTFPGTSAAWDLQDGFIPYGSISIDQRTLTHKNCLDYMTDWCSWLDVQNGANFKGADQFEGNRRFITTPRDLATYVHFDALYEAYLNAALILLAMGSPASKGFPEPSPTGHRDAFATYGGPHILSLV